MKRLLPLVTLLFLLPVLVQAATIEGVRLWTAPDHTRLVFDIDSPVEHKVFVLADPERLVIDVDDAKVGGGLNTGELQDDRLAGVRHAARDGKDVRLVLDLRQALRPRTFLLRPSAGYGHRLVIDLYPREATAAPKVAKSTEDFQGARDVIIAVDAGHGGEDPGAAGRVNKTKEKVITLQIAQRLKRQIDAQPGMRAVLTRSGDYYVGLRKRMSLAREQRADMFVSIHADAFNDARARGSSVYVLSRRGASSEAARWLAEKENAADLVGGVSLDDKDDVLASVLLDLSQSATQHASLEAAGQVHNGLGKLGKVHGRRVQQAGFMVLKSPDVPSMLIETGFISNPTEERNLADPDYQERLAQAIMEGMRTYFSEAPPPGTLLAQQHHRPRRHTIESGDTLSAIASQYQVKLGSLRSTNNIRDDRRIRVGQILTIPET